MIPVYFYLFALWECCKVSIKFKLSFVRYCEKQDKATQNHSPSSPLLIT